MSAPCGCCIHTLYLSSVLLVCSARYQKYPQFNATQVVFHPLWPRPNSFHQNREQLTRGSCSLWDLSLLPDRLLVSTQMQEAFVEVFDLLRWNWEETHTTLMNDNKSPITPQQSNSNKQMMYRHRRENKQQAAQTGFDPGPLRSGAAALSL